MVSTERATRSRLLLAREDERGFTLIELLVVMVVIGILSGIAIPTFLNQREKAYHATVKHDLDNLGSYAEQYQLEHDPGEGQQVVPGVQSLDDDGFRPSDGVEFDDPVSNGYISVGAGEVIDEQDICYQARHVKAPGKDFYIASDEGYAVREVSEDDPGCARYMGPETETPDEPTTGYDELGNPDPNGQYGPMGDPENPDNPNYAPESGKGYDELGNPVRGGAWSFYGDPNNPDNPKNSYNPDSPYYDPGE